jgi:hypothetical protein
VKLGPILILAGIGAFVWASRIAANSTASNALGDVSNEVKFPEEKTPDMLANLTALVNQNGGRLTYIGSDFQLDVDTGLVKPSPLGSHPDGILYDKDTQEQIPMAAYLMEEHPEATPPYNLFFWYDQVRGIGHEYKVLRP